MKIGGQVRNCDSSNDEAVVINHRIIWPMKGSWKEVEKERAVLWQLKIRLLCIWHKLVKPQNFYQILIEQYDKKMVKVTQMSIRGFWTLK